MNTPDDPDFDDLPADDDELSRDWRAASDEMPPPALDAGIRRAAHKSTRRPRWHAPLATAAVVVLGMGLLFEAQNPRRNESGAPAPTAAPAQYDARENIPAAPAPQQPRAMEQTQRPATQMKKAPTADRMAPSSALAQESAEAERQPAPEPIAASAWIARIRALKENGETRRAAQSLQAFRERYSSHAVPADLRGLIEPEQ